VYCCATPLAAQDTQEIQIANEYYLKGDKGKALSSYSTLAKNSLNIPAIHNNYLALLLDLNMFKEAEHYIEKAIQKFDDRLSYKLDLGFVYLKSGDLAKADKYLKNLIKNSGQDIYRLKSMSDYLASRQLAEYAVAALLEARSVYRSPNLFTLEMANLYRMQGKRDEMVNEYLSYVIQTPGNINYIKNLLQVLLGKPEELESLERLLFDRVQQNPNSEVFSDLLIWVNLQQKNFYGAFIQARAYDKRFKKGEVKTLEIAQVSFNNKDYDNAEKAYAFVAKEYPNTDYFLQARIGQIHSREAKVKRRFPVNRDSVKIIIADYKNFVSQYPENVNAYEAQLNQSVLQAYYADQKDSAVVTLQRLITNNRVSSQLRAKAKLELGDIYLLKEEPWESTLLYSQVEKSQKDAPLGYEAKLKNAKLSYYRGDFRLAQEHLDILKQATTREIANDAMDLSMRIRENTDSDSVNAALRLFAAAELDFVQNKTASGLAKLEQILLEFPQHVLRDDVYWAKSQIKLKQGQFTEAISLLEQIQKEFGQDLLADDALFNEAEIYDLQLRNKQLAMEKYRAVLDQFPGSVYAAEARKRYRLLRGDFESPAVP
jgi:TolA-binding protein